MERLGIIVAVDGTLETTSGLKLTSQAATDLGKDLDTLNSKSNTAAQGQKAVADASNSVASSAQNAGRNVAQLGRDLSQGDFGGAARQVGELAMENQALMSSMVGVGGLIGLAVAGVGALAYAASLGAEEQRKLNDTLILTGNYAGLVAGQLDTMASSLARNVNGSVTGSREVLASLTATGKFTTMSLQEVGAAAQLVARFTGQTNEQVIGQFASMGDGVANWAAKANSSYHFLSIETFRYIKQLEEQGRMQEAMLVTSQALSNHLGGDLTNNLGTLQKAWKGVSDWAKDAWQSMMNIGKTETTQEKIDTITARLNYLATQKNSKGWTADQKAQATAALESERAILESDLRQERQMAARRSESAQLTAQQIAEDQKKGRKGGRDPIDREPEAQRRLIAETAGLSPAFAADWDRLTEIYKKNGLTLEWLTEAQGKLLAKQPGIRAATQAEATALREMTQLRERNAQHMERDFANQEKELDGMIKANQGLREQAQQVGLTKEQLGNLKAERLDGVIAQERENLIVAQSNDAGERQIDIIRRRIRLLEQQRGLTQDLTAKTAEADKAKAAEDASKKFGDDVRRDLKDGLIRGFEAGKSPAQSLADTLGNIVKQRLVSAFADSILNSFQPLLEQVLGNARLRGVGAGTSSGGLGGMLSGIFGADGQAAFSQTSVGASGFGSGLAYGNTDLGAFLHGGGVVGSEATFTRPVNPGLFKGSPRFHSGGIAGDEVPIIAQRGEGVFTQKQMANLAPAGGGGSMTVNVYNNSGEKVETKKRQTSNGMSFDVIIGPIEDALADRMNAGTGSLFGSMGSRFGLRTQVG